MSRFCGDSQLLVGIRRPEIERTISVGHDGVDRNEQTEAVVTTAECAPDPPVAALISATISLDSLKSIQ